MEHHSITAFALVLVAGAAATSATAQLDYTVIDAPPLTLQSWNPATEAPGRSDWHPEKPGNGWANGLCWQWFEQDGMGDPIPPSIVPQFDSSVPGLAAAFAFPEARAFTQSGSWEFQAQPNRAGSFEVWFKPADLEGQHVIWEIGAQNKGVAFWLDDDELVYSAQFNDGAGGNVASYEYRQQLTDTEWHQAVLTLDFFFFNINAYLDGALVNTSPQIPFTTTYRWSGGNPAGLGTVGQDGVNLFAGIANDPPALDTDMDGMDDAPSVPRTDFTGLIGPHRFYNTTLSSMQVQRNFDALTDSVAAVLRADFNGDAAADVNDVVDYLVFTSAADTTPIAPFSYPFPSAEGGSVQTNDPAFDDTYLGDQSWDRDDGFNPTSQEPTFRFTNGGVLEPTPVNDLSFPAIRRAFILDGTDAFRGPKFEQADDSGSGHVSFWMHVDDLTGNHCLFEAGGSGVGFSMVTRGDEIAARVNTSVNDGLDDVEITSGPGVLTTGWHKFEIIIRRFAGGGVGQGFELYMDGVQIAALNDLPGPDGEFGTADDINNFSPAGGGNSNFIGGNQGGLGLVSGSAPLPLGLVDGDLTPFNGMVAGFRFAQGQPLPSIVMSNFMTDMGQNVINDRADVNRDGAADFFDTIDQLKIFDNAE